MILNLLSDFKKIPTRLKKHLKNKMKLVVTGVKTSEKVVALTFDDGPHPEYTPLILDLLAKYEAKATFFVVGEAAKKNPSVIKRIVESGHALGNHSWSHSALPLISRKERCWQIRNTRGILPPQGPMLFRPPWGFLNFASYIDVKLLGYNIIGWDEIAYDWLGRNFDNIFRHLDSNIRPGSIILMHDNLYSSIKSEYIPRYSLVEALEIYLKKYRKVYKFVSVPDLLKMGNPTYKYGLRKKNDKDLIIPK